MKFKFKLQTVLSVKEKMLKQTQQELANLITKKIKYGKEIQYIENDIKKCSDKIENQEKFSPNTIKIEYDYYHKLLSLKSYKEQEKDTIEVEVSDKRNELNWQNKEIKVLETLKEKKMLEYKNIAEKQEQAALDEIAFQNHNII